MATYTVSVGTRKVNVTGSKDRVSDFARTLRAPLNIHAHCRELSGVIGLSERSSTYMTIGGPAGGVLANPDKWKSDVARLVASIPDALKVKPNVATEWETQANVIFKEHLPIKDSRISPEVHAAEVKESNEREAAREQAKASELAGFLSAFGSPDKLKVPAGSTAVYAQLTFDASDGMSDYYAPHRSIGPSFLLGYVRKQSETEALARSMVARFPLLKDLPFKWETEKYSGGHGNYLIQTGAQVIEAAGTKNVSWEIQFNSYGHEGAEWFTLAGYPGAVPTFENVGTISVSSGPFVITHEGNWTWIKFPGKPEAATLDAVRGMGARFSGKRLAWYFTRNVDDDTINASLGAQPVDEDVQTGSLLAELAA